MKHDFCITIPEFMKTFRSVGSDISGHVVTGSIVMREAGEALSFYCRSRVSDEAVAECFDIGVVISVSSLIEPETASKEDAFSCIESIFRALLDASVVSQDCTVLPDPEQIRNILNQSGGRWRILSFHLYLGGMFNEADEGGIDASGVKRRGSLTMINYDMTGGGDTVSMNRISGSDIHVVGFDDFFGKDPEVISFINISKQVTKQGITIPELVECLDSCRW